MEKELEFADVEKSAGGVAKGGRCKKAVLRAAGTDGHYVGLCTELENTADCAVPWPEQEEEVKEGEGTPLSYSWYPARSDYALAAAIFFLRWKSGV